MDTGEILERVCEVISDVLGVAVAGIKPDDRLMEDLEAEKPQQLELADALEEEFDVEIDENELMELSTVGDLAELVADTVGNQEHNEEEG